MKSLSRPMSVGVNSPLREMKQVELNRNEVVNRVKKVNVIKLLVENSFSLSVKN